MAEEKAKPMGMPGTEEGNSVKYMQAGLHLAKIAEIVEAVDKEGKCLLDKNGNPAIKVTFQNKAEETISGIYYYSTLPLDHPDRKVDDKRCKSEFRLHQLKTAMGFGVKSVPVDKAKTAKVWLVVKLQDIVDREDNPVLKDGKPKTWHVVGDVYPVKADDPNKGRPVLRGDPTTDSANFHTGVFYEKKVDTTVSVRQEEHLDESDTPAESTQADETPVDAVNETGAVQKAGSEDW